MTKLNSRWLDITQNLPVSNYKITNLAPGVDGTDAVNKNQLDAAVQSVNELTDLVFGPTTSGTIDPGAVAIDTTSNAADVVEEMNAILGYLVPPEPPQLSSFSSTSGITGKLSFGTSNVISGYTNHPTLDINATYTVSGNTKGIINATTNPTGTLADNSAAHAYAYPANAFKQGDKGYLRLKINGSYVHNVNLSSFGSGSTTNGNGSGFTLSAATAVSFSAGGTFAARKYRTGTWVVNNADLTMGYNIITIEHEPTVGNIYSCQVINYVVDGAVTTTTFASDSISGISMTGSKQLSGITYHTGGTATYAITVNNAYRNTYSPSSTAVSHPTDTNCSISDTALPTMTLHTDTVPVSKTITADVTRILPAYQGGSGNQFSVNTQILRTLQGTQTSSTTTNYNVLVDNSSSSATALAQYFDDELRRFLSTSDFNSTSSSPDYTSASSLLTLTGELQVYGGRLIYPTYDFSSVANGPGGNPNYSTCSGTRRFYGYFTSTPGSSNFRLTLVGSGTAIDVAAFNPSSNQITVEMRMPGASGTGWMDCYKAFETDKWSDGDGCYSASLGSTRSINTTNWGITFGTKNTANCGDRVYFRITAGAGFTGYLDTISTVWNAV